MSRASVIITTHNRPHLLPRAIESARRSGADVEIIVVDDASTDETARVCRDFRDIRYVRAERNRKVAGARNLGIMASSREYISFLDDDDQRLPHSLDLQIEALAAAPEAGFVYGPVLLGDQEGASDGSFYPATCPRGDLFWQLLERNFIPCCAALFRKSCLYGVGLLDESIPGADDWDLWIRLSEIYSVASVDQPVAIWRHPTPTSGQGSSETVELISLGRYLLRHRWLALPRALSAPARKRRAAWSGFSKNVSDHLAWEAASALITGNLTYAGKSALTALRLHPSATLGTARRWTRATTLRILLAGGFTRDGLMSAKARFKQARASKSD